MGVSQVLGRALDRIDAVITAIARRPDRSWGHAIFVGLVSAGVMVAVRAALSFAYGGITGFMILLPAVIIAGLWAGRMAGIVAMLACLAGGWLLLGYEAVWGTALGKVATSNFVIVGLFVAVVSASVRKAVGGLDTSLRNLADLGGRIDDSETQLRAMVDQASAGIARVGPDGRVVSTNARFAEILGLTPEQMIGVRTPDVTHPDDVGKTMGALDASMGGSEGLLEKRYLRPDGSVVWAQVSLKPLLGPDGQPMGHIAVAIDITAAKAAEAALRESEQRFRVMADTAPSPVWMTNTEAAVEFVNKALVEFYGQPAEAILGHVWRMSIHPDDQAQVAAAMEASRPRRLPYGFEARFRRADGQWRWMRIAVNPRISGSGEFLGYVGMSFDITDTVEAMAAIEGQSERQRFLLDLNDRLRDLQTPDRVMAAFNGAVAARLEVARVGYAEIDETGRVVTVRSVWAKPGLTDLPARLNLDDFGADTADRLRRGDVMRIDDAASDPRTASAAAAFAAVSVAAAFAAPVLRGGRLRALVFAHHDTPRHWTDDEAALLIEVAARVHAEVERTRAEAEVRESEERFRAIADTAPVLIWVTAQDRSRAFVNEAYVAYNGGTYEEARLADWRAVIHSDDQDRILSESLAGEATGEPFSMEARYLRHDGEYRWLKSFSRPRLGAGGEVLGFVGVAFDVTDIREHQGRLIKSETDLKRINELLEERVGEALAEKAKAEADLMHAQRMEAVGRLTGGVAHDFNNLLTVVIGALDMMLKSPEDAARRKKLGEAALAAARRGEGLTHQLLAFSRRQALRPEAVDLNVQIRQSEPLLTRAVGEAVEFKLKLKRGGARVKVDPAQFEAALLNLVVNARDAVGDRGRVTVETRACTVDPGEVAELAPGGYVCITVSDNGGGMDPAIRDRVFEPFFTTKAVGKGTGLGLSQVYGFARQSGGGVRIHSEVGKGTEIQIFLPPLDKAASLEAPVEARATEARSEGRRLLLVEDDESVAAVAVELLRGLGLKVRVAESAPRALDILRKDRFDLMLSDVVMPGGMTGIELARECGRLYPEMGVVLTSGYAGEDVDAALTDAPWPFLRKPYSSEQLAEMLEAGRARSAPA